MSESKKIDDGGRAFPGKSFTERGYPNGYDMGMSLRDWFAGQALVTGYVQHDGSPDKIAEWAFQIADAMIATRKVGR